MKKPGMFCLCKKRCVHKNTEVGELTNEKT